MDHLRKHIAVAALATGVCISALQSAGAHEVDRCFCNLEYDSRGLLRHPEDVPFVSVFDGSQKILPIQAVPDESLRDVTESQPVELKIDPYENSDISVAGRNICGPDIGFLDGAESVQSFAVAPAAAASLLGSSSAGLGVTTAGVGVATIRIINELGDLTELGQGEDPISN